MLNKEQIDGFIERANRNEFTLPDEVLSIPGLSSPKIKQLLHDLCSTPGNVHLEIGLNQGSTFIPTLYNNPYLSAYGIDSWKDYSSASHFFDNLNKFGIYGRVNIIEQDSWTVDLDHFVEQVDTYFYDGDHSRLSQYKALEYYYPVLADEFLFVVDDFNAPEVHEPTYQAMIDLELDLIYKRELLPPAGVSLADYGWWNGIGIFILRKTNESI